LFLPPAACCKSAGQAYADAHTQEGSKIVAVGESDAGADNAWALQLPVGGAAAPALKSLATVLAPLKVFVGAEPARQAGADFGELVQTGVPPFAFRQDMSRYFDLHHSADDTLDKIDPRELAQNVAVWASFLYTVANSDVDEIHNAGGGADAIDEISESATANQRDCQRSQQITVTRRAIQSSQNEQRAGRQRHEYPTRIRAKMKAECGAWVVHQRQSHRRTEKLVRHSLRKK